MRPKKLEITYRGQSLHIEYFLRPGVKGAVLYLHGLSCSKNDFIEATTAGELSPYTLAAFDFPGCGNSPYPEDMALGIDDLVEITNIARLIGELNRQIVNKEQFPTMLIGPGRWGITTPSLGVPVHFSEINNMAILAEVAYLDGKLMPELSFGTHFFQDLVENNIFLLPYSLGQKGSCLIQSG